MNRINKAFSLMLTAALSCVLLNGYAFAASGDALWADLDQTSNEVAAQIATNTVVSDGVINVTFDAEKLTYAGCDFEGENGQYTSYVAQYAINDTQAKQGIVKISWIAPDAYESTGDAQNLFALKFQTTTDSTVAAGDVKLSGTINTPDGQTLAVGQQSTDPTPSAAPSAAPSTAPDGGNTGNNNTGDNTANPDTGDHANVGLYLSLLAGCVIILAGAGVWNYKRRAAK